MLYCTHTILNHIMLTILIHIISYYTITYLTIQHKGKDTGFRPNTISYLESTKSGRCKPQEIIHFFTQVKFWRNFWYIQQVIQPILNVSNRISIYMWPLAAKCIMKSLI